MKKHLLLYVAAVVLVFMATPALAVPTVENFIIGFQDGSEFTYGEGSGYNDGTGEEDLTSLPTPWYY